MLITVARVVKLVDTADLKSAAFLNKGRTGSIPVPGTIAVKSPARQIKAIMPFVLKFLALFE